MTSEISLVNKRGVVLAADSAVTIGGMKVMNNASKLFTLDSEHYVGIMIYGNADFCNVPWEVIIKTYRELKANKTFDTLQEYGDDFMNYVANFSWYGGTEEVMLYQYLNEIRNIINNATKETLSFRIFDNILKTGLDVSFIEDTDSMGLDFNKFKQENEQKIINYINDNFTFDMDFEEKNSVDNRIVRVVFKLLNSYTWYSEGMTGLVIAGYGKIEPFPTVMNYKVEGIFQSKLKHKLSECITIGNKETDYISATLPFAQSDMINTFMHGIDPEIQMFLNNEKISTQNEFDKANIPDPYKSLFKNTLDNNYNNFIKFIADNYQEPFNRLVSHLSLQELALMGETLISLTSFKRKFSTNIESVGGEIDVLVISRSEGPVWVKRKKYFDKDLNEGYERRRK